jgi:hypothetical protein
MTAKNNNVCKKNVTREVLINGFSIRSPTSCLRKRETPATRIAKFYKQSQKKGRWVRKLSEKQQIVRYSILKYRQTTLDKRPQVLTKTAQGGNQKLADSKWLVANTEEESVCPVRLFKQIMGRRGNHITCEKFFFNSKSFLAKNEFERMV